MSSRADLSRTVVLVVALCSVAATGAFARELRAADTQGEDYPTVQALRSMSPVVSERSNGRHQISIETAQSNLDTSVLASLPGKTILLGVLDLSTTEIEMPDDVAARVRRALPHVPAERLVVAPDCGLKYLPRDVAFAKMQAMVAGAALVRAEVEAQIQV